MAETLFKLSAKSGLGFSKQVMSNSTCDSRSSIFVFDKSLVCLENPSPDFAESLSERFHTLSLTASWANARDVGCDSRSSIFVFDKSLVSN
jgi:hypothetical protein